MCWIAIHNGSDQAIAALHESWRLANHCFCVKFQRIYAAVCSQALSQATMCFEALYAAGLQF